MANDGKIYIIITDQLPTGTPPSPQTPSTNTQTSSSGKDGINIFDLQFFSFMKSQVMKAVNYNISNTGNFTGNYQLQRNIQSSMQDCFDLLNLGNAIISGYKHGGVLGAIGAGTLAILAPSINKAYENRLIDIEQMQTNNKIEQLRVRAGLNQLTNGSRGTLN